MRTLETKPANFELRLDFSCNVCHASCTQHVSHARTIPAAMYCLPGVDTYDGVLNIAGIQYSSVMFIG